MDTYSHVLPGMQASAVAGLEGVLAPKVAMSPAVSRLLARLVNTGPGKIPWRIAVPKNGALGGIRAHDLCLRRAVTESAELDYEERGIAVPHGWLSMFVMVGVNLRNSVR